jgi:hypothetical protein
MRNREYTHAAIAAFAPIAEALCHAIAADDTSSPDARLKAIHELLPQAYAAALRLPSTTVLFDEEESSTEEGEGDSPSGSALPERGPKAGPLAGLAALEHLLGPRRFYREVFDPYSEPNNPEVTGDIIDDLSDLHDDLAAGLMEWRKGNPGEALWRWRFSFESHWGEHVTSALRALFALSAWHEVPWPAGAD